MEILQIGKQAVKVSLNKNEAVKYKVTLNDETNDEKVKEAFSLLLKEIKKETNFSYANKKIFTEIFPSKDGGCEIYISCISDDLENRVYKEKSFENEIKKKEKISIYEFDNLEKLLNVSYRLNEINHRDKTSVYYDEEKKRYFLVLEETNTRNIKYAFLLEYAKYIKSNLYVYLKEHCKCIVNKNAIKLFSNLT